MNIKHLNQQYIIYLSTNRNIYGYMVFKSLKSAEKAIGHSIFQNVHKNGCNVAGRTSHLLCFRLNFRPHCGLFYSLEIESNWSNLKLDLWFGSVNLLGVVIFLKYCKNGMISSVCSQRYFESQPQLLSTPQLHFAPWKNRLGMPDWKRYLHLSLYVISVFSQPFRCFGKLWTITWRSSGSTKFSEMGKSRGYFQPIIARMIRVSTDELRVVLDVWPKIDSLLSIFGLTH
jgi:hypothetical protein